MASRPLAPHVLAAIGAVQRQAAAPAGPQLAPHVAKAIAAIQARPAAPAAAPRAPHVQAAIQARPAVPAAPLAPHIQAAIQARPAASAPAVAPWAPHVQAALDRARAAATVQPKAAPHPVPAVQPMKRKLERDEEKEEEKPRKKRNPRRSVKKIDFTYDPFSHLDDPNYGKNPNYEKQRAKFDLEQRKKFKKVKKKLGKLKKIPHVSSNVESELSLLTTGSFMESFESLKGNLEAESYALKVEVESGFHLFKTSYNQDVGLAPLYLDEDEKYRAGKNRPFTDIAGDLDDFIGEDKSLRKQVGAMIKVARDGGKATWGENKPKKKKRLTLETAIAELAIIFQLDLARAGEHKELARSHQNALLKDSKLSFTSMLTEHYLGIKASNLRDEEMYESSEY